MTPETRKTGQRRFAGLVGSLLLIAVGLAQGAPASAAERRIIWERQDQFVAVEKQDGNASFPPLPSDHPAQLTADTLRATLGSLQVKLKGDSEPVPLLTPGELETLGDALRQGLSVARPDEDATFALIGLHPSPFGFLKQPMVTTGRVFVSKGKLNLILGMVHDPVSDYDDRRLKPFIPGSRVLSTRPAWRVTTTGGETVQIGAERPDWLILSLATAPPAVSPHESIAPAQKTPTSATPPALPPRPAGTSIEERLLLLKALHDKGLITEDEYRAKRQEILKDL